MSGINSQAEQYAKEATNLNAFNNLNLIGVKEQVAELLAMIGRVEGIFSTYSKHDISHIDAMLTMLDWVIPPSTKQVLTPTDWLLIVLALYLHDLGMFVPSAEYDSRYDNPAFQQFLDNLNKDPGAKDYLARAKSMNEKERERFFYQEFIRSHHASRIREWISGRLSRSWPQAVQQVAKEIADILKDLPVRFREHLAVVCESHHKDDLNKLEIYPLYQMYGSSQAESANVQYAALILRTVDLIHVTKDRTPSRMYRLINFSDLKSVDEWDKQKDTFSVHMKTRTFNPSDIESHVIVVNADFTEERPFFALTEYLAWADNQIKLNKRWADKSQSLTNGEHYFYPWRGIQGNILVEGNSPRQMKFELDRGRLLDLLVGHTIYNDPTVALRELLQNSIDAVRFQYHQGKQQARVGEPIPTMGSVIVKWDSTSRELIVQDDGTGMDLDIIQNHLLKVGSSFYDTPQFESENADFSPISRFGIGILTCFMVSDNIEILTCRGNEGRRIRMTSVQAEYLLKELQSGDPQLEGLEPHGTRVRLILRPSVDLSKKSIADILRQWIILPECNVMYYEDENEAQKVGFDNPKEALRYLFIQNNEDYSSENFPFEIVVSSQLQNGESYQLAYLLTRGLISERQLLSDSKGRAAAVCLEGVRVDWSLPGFSADFPCLLSVRNNRKFRTTVSRSNLEKDEEFFKVAKICFKVLFEHIRADVERIAEQPGRPLLQASSAGRYSGRSLQKKIQAREMLQTGNELYASLPLVVIENLGSLAGTDKSQRSLKSLNEVKTLPEFWTIESRTVDYLSTISRDLGRELSIVEFLGTLAPELQDPRLTPVVADAHHLSKDLLQSHYIASVEFSRKHQRTLLRWQPKADSAKATRSVPESVITSLVSTLKTLGAVNDSAYRPGSEEYEVINVYRSLHDEICVGKVTGDLPDVFRVSTRIAYILSDTSELGALWLGLGNSIFKLLGQNEGIDTVPLLAARYVIGVGCAPKIPAKYSIDYRRTDPPVNNYWMLLLRELLPVIEKHGLTLQVPSDVEKIIGSGLNLFDASVYWMDWDAL